jgi:hypothetical protein
VQVTTHQKALFAGAAQLSDQTLTSLSPSTLQLHAWCATTRSCRCQLRIAPHSLLCFSDLPPLAGICVCLVDQYCLLQGQILELDRQVTWHRSKRASMATIPGIRPLAASVSLPPSAMLRASRTGEALQRSSAWCRNNRRAAQGASRADIEAWRPLRWLLVVGGLAVIRYAQRRQRVAPS